MNSVPNIVLCLTGATATGKTRLAMRLADILPVDLISVDSATVYRGMDIGTGKPEPDTLASYPHRLIDIRDPASSYSVANFLTDAKKAIKEIQANGKLPLLVGGSMLYFNALRNGLSAMPTANKQIREAIYATAKTHGWEYLHQELQSLDPQSANRLKPKDSQRIMRALEVYQLTGKTLNQHWAQAPIHQGLNQPVLHFATASPSREQLHERIAKRFHLMLRQGLIEEVAELKKRADLTAQTPTMRIVGYRQTWAYLNGEISIQELQSKGIIATRQLAKRQQTWLRRWPDLCWLADNDDQSIQIISSTLAKYFGTDSTSSNRQKNL